MIIANRIAFAHDGPDANTTFEALRAARVIVALGPRAEAANPDDRRSWFNQVARLDRLAVFLVAKGRFDDGLALQRVVVHLAGSQGSEAERVRNNVAWAAERRIMAARDAEAIDRAVSEAKDLIECERRAALCEKLDAFARARRGAR